MRWGSLLLTGCSRQTAVTRNSWTGMVFTSQVKKKRHWPLSDVGTDCCQPVHWHCASWIIWAGHFLVFRYSCIFVLVNDTGNSFFKSHNSIYLVLQVRNWMINKLHPNTLNLNAIISIPEHFWHLVFCGCYSRIGILWSMLILFLHFPKDISTHMQRSGVPTGITISNNNMLNNILST